MLFDGKKYAKKKYTVMDLNIASNKPDYIKSGKFSGMSNKKYKKIENIPKN